jgi:SOS-response transcriptional repressor LexA
MNGLSPRQAEIYRYIQTYCTGRGISPTFREIAVGTGLALSTVTAHIKAMKDNGFIIWDDGTARSVRIVK